MRRFVMVLFCLFAGATAASAQDMGLVAEDVTLEPGVDAFGVEILTAQGELDNQGDMAYGDISLLAEAYDSSGEIVGEGFGYPVTACGAGLLADFVMEPGDDQSFSIPLELYEDDVTVDRVEVTPQATELNANEEALPLFLTGITPVSGREVVAVEWIDGQNLRFGAGCFSDLFNRLDWFQYDLQENSQRAIAHPNANLINDQVREALILQDPVFYENSAITFDPNGARLLYQTDLHNVVSAERDGSFRRIIFDTLANRTLQGIVWLPEGRFMAYYYGAYGDPVVYLTGNVSGQQISFPADQALPSTIVPGVTPDGARLIIHATVDGTTGYFIKAANFPTTELLFEGDAPGNNWPAPIFTTAPDGQSFIYIARPVDDVPTLQCFNVQTRELRDLSQIPLRITNEERARWWLSPDGRYIALGANGVNGGLWTINLGLLPNCA
jgi:hypothetical protein